MNWLLDDRINVTLFAGMGGGCDGLEAAGYPVALAINHDPVAIAVHQARHPHTEHMRCDVFEVDPREAVRGRRVGVLHASPDCTHFSVAKGSKPVSKRRRSLAWVICRWAGVVQPELITMENVAEIMTWGPLVAKRDPATGRVLRLDGSVAAKGERVPVREQWLVPDKRHAGRIWRAFVKHLRGLGYEFEWKVLVCADYGVPTIRKRFFGVARRDGEDIAWPQRTHAPRDKAKGLKLKPWVGAHTIIDWSLPVKSIFGRQKPLAEATLRRVARGVMRYVVTAKKPFIVPITHTKAELTPRSTVDPLGTITTARGGENMVAIPHLSMMRNAQKPFGAADEPLHTLTAGGAGISMVSATMVGAGGRAAQIEPRDLDEPLNTTSTKEDRILVAANLAQLAHGESGGRREYDLAEPATTVHAGGGNQALVASFLAQHNNDTRRIGGVHPGRAAEEPIGTLTVRPQIGVVAAAMAEMRGASKNGRDVSDPLVAITAGGGHAHLIAAFLQTYYGSGDNNHSATDPLHTVTVKERHGLVTVRARGVERYIDDIGIRMLEPEEGAAAHGFAKGSLPDEITIDGVTRRLTKTEKYHLVGNSVPPRMIQLLVEANMRPALMVAAE